MNPARTDFLFATPSFLTGAGTVFNLAGSSFIYAYSKSKEEADAKAIASDWAMTGVDIQAVLSNRISKELHSRTGTEKGA